MSILSTQVTAESVTTLATHFVKSGFFKDTNDISKAVVKIMAGQELGIGPMASMTGINVVEGKIAMSANLIASQIKKNPKYDYKIISNTNECCEIEFLEMNGKKVDVLGSSVFTIDDAKKAQLASKNVWQKYPAAMLFNRALTKGARLFCPDVFNGSPIYTEEELEDVSKPAAKPVVNFTVEGKDLVEQPKQELPKKITDEEIEELTGLLTEAAELTGKDFNEIVRGTLSFFAVSKIQDLYEPYATKCIEYARDRVKELVKEKSLEVVNVESENTENYQSYSQHIDEVKNQ